MCGEPTSGANGTNANGAIPTVHKQHHAEKPFQSVKDFLSNTDKFQIIESTLREGEQFANAFFDTGASFCLFLPRRAFYPSADQRIANFSAARQRPRSRCTPEILSPDTDHTY